MDRAEHDARRKAGILSGALADTEKAVIEDALAWTRGNRAQACEIVGLNRAALWHKARKYGIDATDIGRKAAANTWVYRTAPEGAPWSAGREF